MSGHVWSAKFDPRIAWHRSRFAVCKAKSSEAPVSSFWFLMASISHPDRIQVLENSTDRFIKWFPLIPPIDFSRHDSWQDCFWGIYTEQQNRQIEEAYQGAERQVEITVGVRRSSFTKWFRWGAQGGVRLPFLQLPNFEMVERPPYGNIGGFRDSLLLGSYSLSNYSL